jgi:flagellar hook-associated protein 3 FlgL
VLDTSIGRDVNELIDIVSTAINAHDKVSKIKEMMKREQFADDDSQANLQTYLDAAEKEAAYADDNLQKTYSQYITNFENYLEKANMAQTNVGSLENRLSLTQTRVENQKATVEELKTNNDNRDISDIIIDYYAAYNAYTASLTAAAKVGQQTLLNYL